MKNIFTLLLGFLLLFQSCTSQTYLDSATLENVIRQQEFTFVAQRAHPTSMDATNVLNTLPNANTSRIYDLDSGYGITFKNKQMEVTLPYFGRSYSAHMGDAEKNSLRFTSKDFLIEKNTTKKGNTILNIQPKDVRHIRFITIETFKNGKAYVSVSANDRQPISFDGYIMKNE